MRQFRRFRHQLLRTRSPDIDSTTPIGVISPGVIDGRGTDGNDRGLACRGGIVSVRSGVTGSDDGGNTRGDEAGDGVVDDSGFTTGKAQRGNRRATCVTGMPDNPVNSVKAV